MTLSPIYGSYSSSAIDGATNPATETATASQSAAPSKSKPVSLNPVDTVQISQGAQAQALAQQGQSPTQIATSLGLPVSMVDTDLGITPTGSVAVTVPASAMKAPPTAL